jgi:hypothetical protein
MPGGLAQQKWFWPSIFQYRIYYEAGKRQSLVRPSPAVMLSMWPSNRKLDEEKSKHIGFAQQNGFGLIFFSTQ